MTAQRTTFTAPLRTRRLDIRMREIPVATELEILGVLPGQYEQEITMLLRAAIVERGAGHSAPTDPEHWTVQERWMAMAWYTAACTGDMDYELGGGTLSDYLCGDSDRPMQIDPIPLGELYGEPLMMRHLTGGMLERIEGIALEFQAQFAQAPVLFWEVAAMAAMIYRAAESPAAPQDDAGAFEGQLVEHISELISLPPSDLYGLSLRFYEGMSRMSHLFAWLPSKDGLVVMPREGRAGGVPARFCARPLIHERTRRLASRAGD